MRLEGVLGLLLNPKIFMRLKCFIGSVVHIGLKYILKYVFMALRYSLFAIGINIHGIFAYETLPVLFNNFLGTKVLNTRIAFLTSFLNAGVIRYVGVNVSNNSYLKSLEDIYGSLR